MSTQTPTTATPGPWRVGEHHAGTICIEADSTPRRITVARVHIFNHDDGEPAANARLIAAAPELRAALAAFVEIAVLALNHFAEDDTRGMTNAAIDEARALLARLDGRS